MSTREAIGEVSSGSISIRTAEVADAGELHAVGIEVTAATYCPIDEEYAGKTVRSIWSIEALRDSLARYPHWVAVDETGSILGVANLGEFDGRSVMGKLFVRPKAHGRGVGTRLLAAVMEAAEEPELTLEYLDGNASAAAFCAAHGFVEVGRTPALDGEGLPDMIVMRRTL